MDVAQFLAKADAARYYTRFTRKLNINDDALIFELRARSLMGKGIHA